MAFWRANERAITVISVLAGSLVLWEFAVRVSHVPQFLLPAPSVVIAELFKAPGLYAVNSLATLRVTLTGFGLAVVLGILLAVAIVHSRIMEHSLYTLLVALNSLPKGGSGSSIRDLAWHRFAVEDDGGRHHRDLSDCDRYRARPTLDRAGRREHG
jgi:hypothetical protein